MRGRKKREEKEGGGREGREEAGEGEGGGGKRMREGKEGDPLGELASLQAWLSGEDASFDADVEQQVSMVKHTLCRAG